jgi:threonine-phosphate decarboxylase
MIHGHGGNIREAARRLCCDPSEIADMSSNVNPLGPMPGLLEHLRDSLEAVRNLPEADAGAAVRAFSKWRGIHPDQALAGCGTTQFLYQMPLALGFKSALVAGPAYADYADACAVSGVPVELLRALPDAGFAPDMERLARAAKNVSVVFFCNPNNPTGRLTSGHEVAGLVQSAPDTLFVVDESYLPFVPGNDAHSLARAGFPNVLVLHSLSKMFCIPGLRVGFAIGPSALVERLARCSPPWTVNALAQEACRYVAEHPREAEEHEEKTRRHLKTERAAFEEALSGLEGLRVFPGCATFVLVELKRGGAAGMVERALTRRLLFRDCANFEGLGFRFFRVSLKGTEENRRAAEAIRDFCGELEAGSPLRGGGGC